MNQIKICDDDNGTVTALHEGRGIRYWTYDIDDRPTQKLAMFKAREFAEGWFQCRAAMGEKHMHQASRDGSDNCNLCGRDLRDSVHAHSLNVEAAE